MSEIEDILHKLTPGTRQALMSGRVLEGSLRPGIVVGSASAIAALRRRALIDQDKHWTALGREVACLIEREGEQGMSEIKDRRQRARARVSYYDSTATHRASEDSAVALELAIEVATQVKITTEIIAAASATGRGYGFDMTKALKAAFRAAGFEVIE